MEKDPTQKTPLQLIAEFLEEETFDTKIVPPSKEHPFERLLVSLGQDEQERLFTMQLHFVNDITSSMGNVEDPDDIILLECFLLFPFKVEAKYFSEVARLILTVNRLVPVGALGMSEPDGSVYLQYHLSSKDRNIDEKIILEVVNMIGFFTGEFAQKIEAVGNGTLEREAYLNELVQTGIVLAPLGDQPSED